MVDDAVNLSLSSEIENPMIEVREMSGWGGRDVYGRLARPGAGGSFGIPPPAPLRMDIDVAAAAGGGADLAAAGHSRQRVERTVNTVRPAEPKAKRLRGEEEPPAAPPAFVFGPAPVAAPVRAAAPSINSSRHPDEFVVSTSPDPPPAAGGAGGAVAPTAPVTHQFTEPERFGLSIADTIHDAWGGYRNKEPANEDIINPAIADIFARRWGGVAGATATKMVSNYLETVLDDRVLLSNIEDSTIAYFEKHSDFIRPRAPNAVKTYDEIIALADVEATAHAERQGNDTYVIKTDKKDVDGIITSFANKDKVNRFILKFLLDTTEADIYMTFDAAPMAVGKLFRDHTNVSGLIMPQNIGDSATTSFKQLGRGVDLYKFPVSEDGRFVGKRSILSEREKGLVTYYEDEGFSKTFPFHFRYGLQNVLSNGSYGPAHAYMSYKNGYNQGPSLDYLLELMLQAREPAPKFTRVVPTTSCLRIGDSIEFNPVIKKLVSDMGGSIFLDIKRGGDQDACDAAFLVLQEFIKSGKYVILVTLDRLCSLLARLLGIPCILHHGDTLTLFKNSMADRTLTPAQRAAFHAAKISNYVTQYMELYNKFANPNALKNLATFMCSIRDQIRIEDAPAPAGKKSKRVELPALVPLIRNRFVDIYNHLKGFALRWPKYGFPAIPAGASMTAKKETIEGLIALFGEEVDDNQKGYDQNFLLEISAILDVPQAFDATKEYNFLKYSFKQYRALEKPLTDFIQIQRRGKPLRDPENYEAMLNRDGGFNTLLSGFTSTFFNKAAGILAQEAFLIKGGAQADKDTLANYEKLALVVSRLVGETAADRKLRSDFKVAKAAAVDASQRIRAALIYNRTVPDVFPAIDPELTITCQRGGAIQKGGYFMRGTEYNIIKDICEEANIFMNREVGRVYPILLLKVAIDQLIEHLQLTNPLLEEHNQEIRKNSVQFAQNMAYRNAPSDDSDPYEECHGGEGGLNVNAAAGHGEEDEEHRGLNVNAAAGDAEYDILDDYNPEGGIKYSTDEELHAVQNIEVSYTDFLTLLGPVIYDLDHTLMRDLVPDANIAKIICYHNKDIGMYEKYLPAADALRGALYAPAETTSVSAAAALESHQQAIRDAAAVAAASIDEDDDVTLSVSLTDYIRMTSHLIDNADSTYMRALSMSSLSVIAYKQTMREREPLLNKREITFKSDEKRAEEVAEIERRAQAAASAAPILAAKATFERSVKPIIDTLQRWVNTHTSAHRFDINLDDVLKRVSSADASAFLNKLYTQLSTTGFGVSPPLQFLNTVMSPYTEDVPPTIKAGYPLLYARPDGSPSPGPGGGAEFAAKLAADNASLDYILDRPVMYALTMLATLHDIIVGNVRKKTSLFISILGPLPAFLSRFTVNTDEKYNALGDLMFSILKQIEGQALVPEVLALFAGGARKTRRRRRSAARRIRQTRLGLKQRRQN